MKPVRHFVGLIAIVLAFTTTRPANAEAPIPGQFNSIFEIIDQLVLQGNLFPSTLGGACGPSLKLGFPTITLHFTSSSTCNLNGDIRFSLFPFGASVRLEIMNNPMIQAVDMDIAMSLKKNAQGARQFSWKITNGRIAFRLGAGQPLNEYMMTGSGVRVKSKTSLQVDSRINFFDKATGSGYALVRTVSQVKPNPKVKNVQGCTLTGANGNDVQSGQLTCSGINN